MDDQQLIASLNDTMEMPISFIEGQDLHQLLARYVDHLIEKDVQKLINLLYRIDVSETKLKDMLSSNDSTSASTIIADLIIERQLQKIKFRQQYNSNKNEIDEEEKW